MLGHQIKPEGPEKPLDQGEFHHLGGHKAYSSHPYSQIYFYEDRFELQPNKSKIYYNSIKKVENTNVKEVQLFNRVNCIRENNGKKVNLVL